MREVRIELQVKVDGEWGVWDDFGVHVADIRDAAWAHKNVTERRGLKARLRCNGHDVLTQCVHVIQSTEPEVTMQRSFKNIV